MTNELLKSENIQVINDAPDWQTAVKKASQPLIESKSITENYVENIIRSVQDNGPYMVLSDYFALMHARPGEGVNSIGMSLLVSRTPVDLEGKPVKIFFVMAAVDNVSHLDALQKIMSVFMDEGSYRTILKGDREKIISLFKRMEELK